MTYTNTILKGQKKDKIISFISKLFAALICKKDQLCEFVCNSSTTFELREAVLHMGVWGGISAYAFYRASQMRFGIFPWEGREGQNGV